MAFPAASGHGNLPNGDFSPTIYSQKVLKFFKTASVVEEITNTDFAGEISAFGDSVRIIKEPVITVRDYNRGTQVVDQDLIDDDTTLTIDQSKYYGFRIDDIEAAHAHLNWAKMATESAGYALKDSYDTNVLTAIAAAATLVTGLGSSSSPVTIGFGASNTFTPMDIVARMMRLMDAANVPMEGRWLVATPELFEFLAREDSKLIQVDVTGDPESVVRNSKLGVSRPLHGFTMFKSNNVPLSANSEKQILFGHRSAVSTANSIVQSEKFRDPNSFADRYRGLHVFGRKVLRPAAVGKAVVTYGDA